jgi:trk system potassium uptake protein TrkA
MVQGDGLPVEVWRVEAERGFWMKVIILGAGELGKNLASILVKDHHDVVVVDQRAALLHRMQNHLDVMVIQGECSSVKVLKEAGIDSADLLVAASGDEAANILACKVASHYKVERTFCRLYTNDFFENADELTPKTFGITDVIIPEDETVDKIINVLVNASILEKITLSHPKAVLAAFKVDAESALAGATIRNVPQSEILANVRFAAIVRDGALLPPAGDTVLTPGDEIYVSGLSKDVDRAIRKFDPNAREIRSVLIGGASRIGAKLALKLQKLGMTVRVIAKNLASGEALLDSLASDTLVLNGDPTENDILKESGADNCDAYISTVSDDEDNILSCILAKRMGANKVIATTNKAEYIDVVPEMSMIDCGFNSGLVSVNTVLRNVGTGRSVRGIEAVLHRCNAYVYEFKVEQGAPVADTAIKDVDNPDQAIFAMVFREDRSLNASGDLVVIPGDTVAIITTPEKAEKIASLFRPAKRGIFS